MANYYCVNCGMKYPNVQSLTSVSCQRHPSGAFKGKHVLYQGSEKSQYVCKYCGQKFPSLVTLTGGTCTRHPHGSCQGKHSPAL